MIFIYFNLASLSLVWSPMGSTTTSTGSNSSCDMNSDSTIKLDPVNALFQTAADPNLVSILPSNNFSNVNNLSLNNVSEFLLN